MFPYCNLRKFHKNFLRKYKNICDYTKIILEFNFRATPCAKKRFAKIKLAQNLSELRYLNS